MKKKYTIRPNTSNDKKLQRIISFKLIIIVEILLILVDGFTRRLVFSYFFFFFVWLSDLSLSFNFLLCSLIYGAHLTLSQSTRQEMKAKKNHRLIDGALCNWKNVHLHVRKQIKSEMDTLLNKWKG